MPGDRLLPAAPPAARWVMNKTWRFHRSVDLHQLHTDHFGHWGYIRSGAEVTTFDESMTRFDFDALVLFPTGCWWSVMFLEGAPVDVHVDIATPAIVTGGVVTTVDLDLDVVVRGGEVVLLDMDEFDDHRVRHAYPDVHVRAAEQAAREVKAMIVARMFPFDGSHTTRMNRIRDRSAR